jgi:uncharacterized protein (DUF1501 family)
MNTVTPASQQYKKLITESHALAQQAISGVAKAASGYTSAVTYPNSQLAAGLQTIAQLIHGNVGARVLYLSTGGFDTHSSQRGTHDALLQTLGDGLGAFWQDITAHGHADSVALMTFSEFGRRPGENASRGTDHGSAAPLFVIGGGVQGGVYGSAPDLTNLDNGNLKVQQDFRQVYAALLQNWLGFDPTDILPYGPYQPTALFTPQPASAPAQRPSYTAPQDGPNPAPVGRSGGAPSPADLGATPAPIPVHR